MPWAIRTEDGQFCVYKKTTGKTLKCYPDENAAKDYLAALYANASEKELKEALIVSKQADGRYKIVAVSTAALKDREGETFTVEAIDYDIKLAEKTGEYPEFRLFHKRGLRFGKVEKMRRVGIFAVDEGYSYDDPFSVAVCEKMLVPNPGKWKCSRGFFIIETSGGCPSCGSKLLIGAKHMKAGFKCPVCDETYLDYKGVLDDVHFRKVKTFDVTATDQPAVPWTGVAAFRNTLQVSEDFMDKKELRAKLLKAGLPEDAVDERLNTLTEAQLKEFSDIPFAEVLKEFDGGEEDDDAQVLDLDEVVKEFKKVVEEVVVTKVKELLDGFEVKVSDLGDLEVDMKEVPDIIALKESVASLDEKVEALTEAISKLAEKDEKRLKELVDDMPRGGKLRIRRFKAPKDDEEDGEDDEDEGEEPVGKKKEYDPDGSIFGADGKVAKSMTEFLQQVPG
jgi:hypothetical protein